MAQQPSPSPPAAVKPSRLPEPEDDVLRVDTDLIQVEAIVKDKNGKIVTGLESDDFEIIEDGKTRKVEFFSFVRADDTREITDSRTDKRLSRAELQRTFVFIINNPVIKYGWDYQNRYGVDSGTISYRELAVEASENSSAFLNKFIDQRMGKRDLIAILDSEVDLGVLSNFTNDRQLLTAAVKQMRGNVGKYTEVRLFATKAGLDVRHLVNQNLAVLESARSTVAQLQKVSGRKIVVMLSRALLYNTKLPGTEIINDRLDQLINEANRAGVTFYYLNPSGLSPANLKFRADGAAQKLAEETGGTSIYNTNDLSIGFDEILKENDGYYLLAYQPEETGYSQARRITVRAKKPGLKVQTRSAVYKNEPAAEKPGAGENVLDILASPFRFDGIKITASPVYKPLAKKTGRIKTKVKIDPANLDPQVSTDGLRIVKIDLGFRIAGPDNKLIRQEIKNFILKISEESWKTVQDEGLVYQIDTDVDQKGYFQVNAAVCITGTKQCGSSSTFINTQ